MLKKLINRMIEFAFIFVVSAFLINMGASLLTEVWPVLIVIGIIVVIVIIIYRIVKHKDDSGQW